MDRRIPGRVYFYPRIDGRSVSLFLAAVLLVPILDSHGERMKMPTQAEIAKLPPDGGAEFNRLVFEKSPYLLQHCRNPVDWYPWGEEAFTRARSENKCIFLSVGYSTCHWCHVMEHESFENNEIARLMNEHYICIKVDREERPDLDEIYMNATQLMTQRGGWPNSVWLTPEGKPWYCGTYFPPEDRYGMPGFKTLLVSLARIWSERPENVKKQAETLSGEIKRMSSFGSVHATQGLSRKLVDGLTETLWDQFDSYHGGFSERPKFPPHGSLSVLLYEYPRTQDERLLQMVEKTLTAMSLGGIHDHIGGGFHRYSTDGEWFLPHFEKMLYDNAQLSRAYVDGYLITGNEDFRRVAIGVYDWILREMTGPEGGFYSALDADSEGEEGKFYLWSTDEVLSILGDQDGQFFNKTYNLSQDGNYYEEASGHRPGTNIPFLKSTVAELAKAENLGAEEISVRLSACRQKLLAERNKRIWPHLDDKILTSWNGLAIGSLAYCGRRLKEPRYIDAAKRAADFILSTMRKDDRLLRTYREGDAKLNAYLDDYAFLADGLIELYESTGEEKWLTEARSLVQVLLDYYWDKDGDGFFFTSMDHEDLLLRSKDPFDRALPSGNGMAAKVLVCLAGYLEEPELKDYALRIFDLFHGLLERSPRGTESLIYALALYYDSKDGDGKGETKSNADFFIYRKPLAVEVFLSRKSIVPGEEFRFAVHLSIDNGWHVNSHRPRQDYLIATSLVAEDDSVATFEKIDYPEGREITFAFNNEPLSVYEGNVPINVLCRIPENAAPGSQTLNFNLRTQACDDKCCSAPESFEISVPLKIMAAGGNAESQ